MSRCCRLLPGVMLALLVAACASAPESAPSLDAASRLLDSGQATRALAAVNDILETDGNLSAPARVAGLHLRGEIQFLLQNYTRAEADFSAAIEIDSDDYYAIHRRWASTLMAEPSEQNRRRVASEITAYTKSPDADIQTLLAGYYGYNYLWDRSNSGKMLQRMLLRTADKTMDQLLPDLVLDQMLGSRSRQERLQFARQFVDRFADHVNLPTVLNIIFDDPEKNDAAVSFASELASKQSGNLYIRYYSAMNRQPAIKTGRPSDEVISELVAARNKGDNPPCTDPGVKQTCEFYRDRLFANIDVLHAKQLIGENRYRDALAELDRAIATDDTNARAWMLKGKALAALGKTPQASHALQMALSLNPELKPAMETLSAIAGSGSGNSETVRVKLVKSGEIPFFTDVTSAVGFGNIKAQRVAWGDFNNDGFDDLLLDGKRLFRNAGGKRFIDISKAVDLPDTPKATGGLFVDYDNDGKLDVLVTAPTSILYRNANGVLKPAFYFNKGRHVQRRTEAASFGDFNGDGFVDLYLANYEKGGVQRSICDQDQLFLNIHGKRFADSSKPFGIETDIGLCGRGVVWSDLNNDGRQDVLVANYRLNRNRLLMNQKTTVRDVAQEAGVQSPLTGHTIAAVSADFDGDTRPDIYLTNLAHPRGLHYSERSRLLINQSSIHELRFRERKESGILFAETNADIAAADVDNDGDLDLFVTAVYPRRYSALYLNNGYGHFENVSWMSGTQVANSWGAAFSDFDNDGDLDLVVASADGIHLFRNETTNHNSLAITVNDRSCQRNGIGMKLWLTAGTDTYYREIQAGKGTGTQDTAKVDFGLGRYEGPVMLRTIDTCGNKYLWSGTDKNKKITIP